MKVQRIFEVSEDLDFIATDSFPQDDEVIAWGNCHVALIPGDQTADVINRLY